MKVYIIFEVTPMFLGKELKSIHLMKDDAQYQADHLRKLLMPSELPQYDDYGLESGIDYFVEEHEVV